MLNGFAVITDQWPTVLGILFLSLIGYAWINVMLEAIFGERLTTAEYLSLGFAGWLLADSLLSLLLFFIGLRPDRFFNFMLLSILFITPIPILLRLKSNPRSDPKAIILFLLLVLLISIPLRLAFVSQAILPSYFDSAAHYALIKGILNHTITGLFSQPGYYHMGFHILAAYTISVFQGGIAKTMLILGQIILAFLPISVYFIVRHETKSNWAGTFAVVLSAAGWYMPAHLMDWGKYPALTGLGMIPFVVCLAYLVARNRDVLPSGNRWFLYGMLGVSILITGLAHSRSIIIFGITFLAWIIATAGAKLSTRPRMMAFIVLLIGIILEIIYIQGQSVFGPLFDPYFNKGVLITAVVLLLSIFALFTYPQLVLACFMTIFFMLGFLFIPFNGLIPGFANLTLLDRPFVEMILFLPLSLLGGLGLAGLEGYVQQGLARFSSQCHLVGMLIIVLVFGNAFANYSLYPSDCCLIAGQDDLAAMIWMDEQLPANTHIGIATTVLNVLGSNVFEGYVGSDAGIWITPLIYRGTIPLIASTQFNQPDVLPALCQQKIDYLYVGEIGQAFDASLLDAKPEWYQLILSIQKARVYQVVGCEK